MPRQWNSYESRPFLSIIADIHHAKYYSKFNTLHHGTVYILACLIVQQLRYVLAHNFCLWILQCDKQNVSFKHDHGGRESGA